MKIQNLLFLGAIVFLVQCKSNSNSESDNIQVERVEKENKVPQFVYELDPNKKKQD